MHSRIDALRLHLIGEPRCESAWGVTRLARLDAALLLLLASQPEQPRDRVAAWLWPDAAQRNANLNLRQRLFQLRRRLGHRVVEAKAVLRLADGVQTDLDEEALPLEGELLGGLDFGDLEAFDAWLADQRDTLEQRRADALSGEAARLEARGAYAEAISLCERIVARRPALEQAWRRLMRLHHLRGDRSAAVDAFERFEERVCRERGLHPSGETLALLERIERGHEAPARPHTWLPAGLLHPTRIVGRQDLLAQMDAAWAAGRAVLLLGQGGIGKSRLMESFVGSRVAVVRVRMRAGDASMPYAGIVRLLAETLERFAPALGAVERAELARLLPALGPAPAAAAQQLALWQAAEALLRSSQANGLEAITVDDLHMADDATLELTRWLLASDALAALRWCFTARLGEDGSGSGSLQTWLGDSQRVEPVRVGPLSPQAVAELVDSVELPEPARTTPGFVATLLRHAGGHPFFILETLKALWLGVPQDPGPELPLPASAQALVARRLQRLQPTALELLRLFAVGSDAGQRLEVAAQVLGRPLPALAEAQAALEAAQLTADGALVHDIVRACVLAAMPATVRRELHRALATTLQALPDTSPGVLAQLWSGAEAWREAAAAFAVSARQARHAGRVAECEALWQRSADAAGRAGDDEARFAASCRALSAGMLQRGAEAVLAQLDTLQATARSARQRAAALALRCELLLNLDRAEAALDASTQALESGSGEARLDFELRMLHGRALALTGRVDEAVVALDAAGAGDEAAPDPERQMQARAAVAHALFAAQRLPEALQAQRQALALAQCAGSATEVALQLANLATLAGSAGEAAQAYAAAQEAQRRFTALGMVDGHQVYNAITLSKHAAHHGRLDEAFAVLAPIALADRAQLGATMQALVQVSLVGLNLWLGDRAAIRRGGQELAALAQGGLAPMAQASVLLARLRVSQRLGEPIDAAVDELRELGRAHPQLRANPVLYREWARWEPADEALDDLARCIRAAADLPPLVRALELVAIDIQRPRQPDAAAARARRLWRTLGRGLPAAVYPPDAWWIVARALRDGGRGGDDAAIRSCLRQGRAWIAEAVLPLSTAQVQATFRSDNPANRALLAAEAGHRSGPPGVGC